ncbi:hypothetical protein [Nocardioides houyundeii]|uniref:hypothetical protein n=1 Tax=Nocardioides houyundeii TaxID=2045452 RepID=UPI000DF293CA|nr:hypothetical protein [Nocardioides houyundeii]
MATTTPALTRESLGAWLIKTSPGSTSVEDLLAGGLAAVTTRCVRRSYRTDLIESDQPVLLWISGRDRQHPPGIHAVGRTTGAAVVDRDGQLVMPVELEPLSRPVPRAELLAHPVLSQLEVLRMPAGSNPSFLTHRHLDELRHGWPQAEAL